MIGSMSAGASDEIQCALAEDHVYVTPQKKVLNKMQMKEWIQSEAYTDYFSFIKAMNIAVRGKPLNYDCHVSTVTNGLLQLIEELQGLIERIPPVDQPQRFGNKAFKTWYEQVKERCQQLLETALPITFHKAIIELREYLVESFGNSTRIDYGTGHEMSFCMFLCCLYKIGAFKEKDAIAVVVKIFNSYLNLVRRLQMTYRMEPAGSHGVWSLDDYQFVPFIWGSSQFIGRPVIETDMFVEEKNINEYHKNYMFIGCIKYITTMKTGHFSEHSNVLWNISGVKSWSKVNEGLLKMYDGEVLNKFPVIQHVVFGSLLQFVPTSKSEMAEKVTTTSNSDCFRKPSDPKTL